MLDWLRPEESSAGAWVSAEHAADPAVPIAVRGRNEWNEAGWLGEAGAWVREQLGVDIECEQISSWDVSAVVAIGDRSSRPLAFLKALPAQGEVELRVTRWLSERFAPRVARLIACQPQRRWLLLEAGPGELLEQSGSAATWQRAARDYFDLQVAAAERIEELAALGVPRLDFASLAARLADLLSDEAVLRSGSDALDAAEFERVPALADALAQACVELEGACPEFGLDHGDLWPGNVIVGSPRSAVIDWDDVRIAPPVLSLGPLLAGARVYQPGLDPGRLESLLEGAFVAAWRARLGPELAWRAFVLGVVLSTAELAARYRATAPELAALHPWMADNPAWLCRWLLERGAPNPENARS